MFLPLDINKENACCFTGHRKLGGQAQRVRGLLRPELVRLVEDAGVDTFLAGGAIGFDTLAAQEVLLMKGDYPWVRLVLALPCVDQEARWNHQDQAIYHALLRQADQVIYVGEAYTRDCMFVRNRFLVDHSAYCVCFLHEDAPRGGTLYTVNYARGQGAEVINLFEQME